MKVFRFTFLTFLVFLHIPMIGGDLVTLVMNDEEKVYKIGNWAQIYEDNSGRLDVTDVISAKYHTKFQDIDANYPNLGVSRSTFWIRFKLKSTIDFRGFLFNIGYLFHDKLVMYEIVNGVPEQIFFSDIETGSISHEHHKRDRFAVPLDLRSGQEHEYYLSINDHEGISLFLEVSSEENFLKRQANDSLRVGLISGIFLLASIFALIVYWRDKQSSYLFFFLLNFFFALTMMCHNGNLQMLFWSGNLKLNHDFFIFTGFATNAFSFLFSIYFLELPVRHPKWFIAGIVFAGVMGIGAMSPMFGLDQHLAPFYLTQIMGSAFEIVISYLSFQKGFKLAKPFLISRLMFSTSILWFAMIRLGWLPYPGADFELLGGVSMCFQVTLMAFVITDYKYKIEIDKLAEEKENERQRNEELRQANKVKMEFLGMASHDLKGPLRNISALASFIENKQVTSDEEVFQMSSMIRQSSEKLANLVKDLLDNTALEMGKLELKLADINAIKCIQSCIDQYELEARRKNQTIHLIANFERKLTICVDEIRFTQVIENLISNAIKFSPFGKNIWVILSKSPNATLLVEVKDEGPGFTEEDKKYLFNYYKKLSAKPTGKENSSGLGLSIVKKIVQLHNGKIWLESQEGQGASFFVEI